MTNDVQPLAGDLIVDLSDGIPGGYCGKILNDAGATVVVVEPPTGTALRRWVAADVADEAIGDAGALFEFLAAGKQSVVVDADDPAQVAALEALVRRADGVLWSSSGRVAAAAGLDPAAVQALAPRAVVTAWSSWGLDSPWADVPGTEFTMQALSGSTAYRGVPTGPPLAAAGRLGEWAAGVAGANGHLAARARRHASGGGPGELVDVSLLEATILISDMYPVTWHTFTGYPFRHARDLPMPSIHPARDGWIGFKPITGEQWLDFCVLIGRADWMADEALILESGRQLRYEEIREAIDSWTRERGIEEIIEQAVELRVPVARIGSSATVPSFDHMVDQRLFVKNPAGFEQPDRSYRLRRARGDAPIPWSPGMPPSLGEHTGSWLTADGDRQPDTTGDDGVEPVALPFAGVRVLDLTGFWVGPMATHFLAMLGAEVIHVEARSRLDGTRRWARGVVEESPKPVDRSRWWEYSSMYQATNSNKLGITLDLETEEGRAVLLELVASCDIVAENNTPRVMEKWGLDYDELRAVKPDLIMARMGAYGLEGPWRNRPGYAQTLEMAAGLSWIMGFLDASPAVHGAACDPLAASHATTAMLLALEHRRRTGEGLLIESSMLGAALNVSAEQHVEHARYGVVQERAGNHGPAACPQNVYRSADVDSDGTTRDTWVAIAVETDEQWAGLVAALGAPGWATDPVLAGEPGRRAAESAIDEQLAAWCDGRDAATIVHDLWAAGVPAAQVIHGHHQPELPPLQARSFFETMEHPLMGPFLHQRYPARLTHGPERLHRSPAPSLGQHNHGVLGGLAGLSDERLAELTTAGVIGETPYVAGET